jgi:hypothetical protein
VESSWFQFLRNSPFAAAAFGYEYFKLQPKHHFAAIPVVNEGSAKLTNKQSY